MEEEPGGGARGGLDETLKPLGMQASTPAPFPSPSGQEMIVSAASAASLSTARCANSPAASRPWASTSASEYGPEEAIARQSQRARSRCSSRSRWTHPSAGRDTGLASARPIFQAFPGGRPPRLRLLRGIVRVDRRGALRAVPEPTFLWSDVRPRPRFGTADERVMDTQTTVDATARMSAFVQSIVRPGALEDPARLRPGSRPRSSTRTVSSPAATAWTPLIATSSTAVPAAPCSKTC